MYWPYLRTILFILAGVYISFFTKYSAKDWEFYLGIGVVLVGLLEGIRLYRDAKKKQDEDKSDA